MQRIYLPNIQFSDVLEISEKHLYHQLTRVLRARVGQEVIFFDGENQQDHLYSMIHIDKNSVSFKRKEILFKYSELSHDLTLYQAYPNKLSKFETIVQKCSEVGYCRVVFFESERSQKIVISENKKERLTKIAIEAIELCGGNIIPLIEYRSSLGEITEGMSIVCHTQSKDSMILDSMSYAEDMNIIVGPEGGFSREEVNDLDAKQVYFGERILRCETVGEVVGFYISQKKES